MNQDVTITQLKSKITVLEQLLNEYEQATITQSERLETALSAQKRQIEELKEKNTELERFNVLIASMEEGVVFADAQDRIVEVNPYFARFVGIDRDEIKKKTIWDFHHGALAEKLSGYLDKFRKQPGTSPIISQASVGSFQVILRVQPIYRDQIYNGVLLNVIDVTDLVNAKHEAEELSRSLIANLEHEKKLGVDLEIARDKAEESLIQTQQAEKALRIAHEHNRLLLASISSILIGVDSDDLITHWNSAAEIAFGITKADIIGQPFIKCNIQWDWAEIIKRIRKCREDGEPVLLDDIQYTRSNEIYGSLKITISPFERGEIAKSGFLILGEDITQNKMIEEQLRRSQKLESIGLLAAGIAHEINTPIQYVGDNLRFFQESYGKISDILYEYNLLLKAVKTNSVSEKLLTEVEKALIKTDIEYMSEEIPSAIQQSLEGIDRVANIVRAMKGFAHPGIDKMAAININEAINSTITISRNEWKYVAEMEIDMDPNMPLVTCLPGEFNQVILNIITNAAHAITGKVKHDSGARESISISTRCDDGWVEIRISDTGTGIPDEIRSKVFNPFFTTKDVGKGTGQGLAIAYDVIVKKHDGTINFETEMGKGTTFIIRLPVETKLVLPR